MDLADFFILKALSFEWCMHFFNSCHQEYTFKYTNGDKCKSLRVGYIQVESFDIESCAHLLWYAVIGMKRDWKRNMLMKVRNCFKSEWDRIGNDIWCGKLADSFGKFNEREIC